MSVTEPDLATKLKLSAALMFARGREFFTQGRYDESNEAYQKGLAADPQDHEGWTGLADVFWVVESYAQAERCYTHALILKLGLPLPPAKVEFPEILHALSFRSGFPPAEIGLAETLIHDGRPTQAIEILNQISCPEQQADIDIAFGNAHMQLDNYRKALRFYGKAVRRSPQDAACWRDLAMANEMRGHHEKGLEYYETAVQVSLNNPDGWFSRFTLGCAYLLRGYAERGWTMYEYRRHNPVWGDHQVYKNEAQWDGTQLDGTLVLYEEQGLGDLIQFMRYVPLTAAKVKTLILDLRPDHRCLAALMELPDNVLVKGEMVMPFDCVAPMLSQPFLLKLFPPLEVPPYLTAPAAPKLPNKATVSLTWTGNPKHRNDRRRSMPLELLAPLIKSRPDISWVTVSPEKKVEEDIARTGLPISRCLTANVAEAASFMAACGLVISVDTSHLHLAGALGVPAWGLLPFSPDWRWGLGSDRTPWYSSVKLYRQQTPKDGWPEVVGRVTADLRPLMTLGA